MSQSATAATQLRLRLAKLSLLGALVLGSAACKTTAGVTPETTPPALPNVAATQAAAGPSTGPVASPTAPDAPVELSLSKPLVGVQTIDEALAKVRDAFSARGFGVITEIDVQAVMKKRLGIDRAPYWILGICNPKKANEAIGADPRAGLLLPCKVIVYQGADGGFVVAMARPTAVFRLLGNEQASALATSVESELRAAFDAL